MTKSAIVVMCLLFTIFLLSHCKTKDQQFYLRMQLVDFANYKQIRIIEDTIYFNAKDIESAFIKGNNIAKGKMIENERNNIETYYFEIKNIKNENLIRFINEDVKFKNMILNTNNKKIQKLNLIID